ncbi:hypothetical protein [Coleofasciculus sp.]
MDLSFCCQVASFYSFADETQKQFIRPLILAGEKQVVNNRLAIHPSAES